MNWTEEANRLLRTLHAEKLSGGQIADAVGKQFDCVVTRNMVISKIRRLNLGVVGHGRVKPAKPKTKAKPKPTEPIPPTMPVIPIGDFDIPLSQRRSLFGLTSQTCRWPVGDPGDPGFFFCGALPADGHPYCAAHCERTYNWRVNSIERQKVAA